MKMTSKLNELIDTVRNIPKNLFLTWFGFVEENDFPFFGRNEFVSLKK